MPALGAMFSADCGRQSVRVSIQQQHVSQKLLFLILVKAKFTMHCTAQLGDTSVYCSWNPPYCRSSPHAAASTPHCGLQLAWDRTRKLFLVPFQNLLLSSQTLFKWKHLPPCLSTPFVAERFSLYPPGLCQDKSLLPARYAAIWTQINTHRLILF